MNPLAAETTIAFVTIKSSLWVLVVTQGECVITASLVSRTELKPCGPSIVTVAPLITMS
jgi:hypothetical protein